MISKKLYLILVLLLSLIALPSSAQKKITAEGDYIATDDDSPKKARAKARDKAIFNGLEKEYGTYMSQEGTTIIENKNGQSDVNVRQETSSLLKGECYEIKKEEYSEKHEGGMHLYHAKVTFLAREVTSATVDFIAKVLKKGTEDSYESSDFRNGDQMYLSFTTPKKGYVAVYLVEDDYAYCLLPYRGQTDGICQVDANKRYVFFSPKDEPNGNNSIVDEFAMGTDKDAVKDIFWILFSPNEFTKPVDAESGRRIDVDLAGIEGLPRELPYERFQKWKSKLQGSDKKMSVKSITITVRK